MSEFIVHSIPGSPFGRAVLAVLEEKGCDYRLQPVAPAGLKSDAHLARHPFGRVPVLQHGDFSLFETQAILRYLERVAPEPRLTPVDAKAAGRMDQAMNVSDWYVFQGVGDVIGFQRVVAPMVLGIPSDEAAIAAAMPRARHVFAALGQLLGGMSFFAGETVSLADFMLAPQLEILSLTPEWEELTGDKPALKTWLERMLSRPSLQATTLERLQASLAAS